MVSVVIHAGHFKTATSTIQSIAHKNREHLREEFGVLYPATGARGNQGIADPDSVAHHLLFHWAKASLDPARGPEGGAKLAAGRTKLADEVRKAGARRVLVSTELLSLASPAIKDRFLSCFDGLARDISVVYAVRRPDELIDSMNIQMLRAGRGRLRAGDAVAYRTDIEHWIARVGPDRVNVLYFSKRGYDGYIRRMFAFAGIDISRPGLVTKVHVNGPMSVSGHVVREMIFARLRAKNLALGRQLRHEINLAVAPIEETLTPGPRLVTLGPADRVRILEANRAELDLVKTWLSPEDSEVLEQDYRQGIEGLHPEPNLGAPMALDKDDLTTIYRGITASPVLRDLMAD